LGKERIQGEGQIRYILEFVVVLCGRSTLKYLARSLVSASHIATADGDRAAVIDTAFANVGGIAHLIATAVNNGAKVLADLGVELSKVRSAVEFSIGRGEPESA